MKTNYSRNSQTSRDSNSVYLFDVNFFYPDHLHDAPSAYPLAPTKQVGSNMWLSELQLNIWKKMKHDKAIPKENYTINCLTLQLEFKIVLKIEN